MYSFMAHEYWIQWHKPGVKAEAMATKAVQAVVDCFGCPLVRRRQAVQGLTVAGIEV